MNITKERAKEILKQFEIKRDLFNWCNEYKDFINNCVNGCFSMEVDYILKKSYEDNEAPFSYEDLDLFSFDNAVERIIYEFDELDKDNIKEFLEEINEDLYHNKDTKEQREKRLKDFLCSLEVEELKELIQENSFLSHIDLCECEAEVYEWWYISDPLKYRLEKQGEVILNACYWGRCTTGQSISLDWCCIKAFISILKDRI